MPNNPQPSNPFDGPPPSASWYDDEPSDPAPRHNLLDGPPRSTLWDDEPVETYSQPATKERRFKFPHFSRRTTVALGVGASLLAGVGVGSVYASKNGLAGGHESVSASGIDATHPKEAAVASANDLTIALPESEYPDKEYSSVPVAEESERGKEGYCEVVDVPMGRAISAEQIAEGAKTETALSTEEIRAAFVEIDEATTQSEIQAIISPIFEKFGPTVVYDGEISGVKAAGKIAGQEGLDSYREAMKQHLRGASEIPREMLDVKTLNFVTGSKIVDEDGNEAAGMFTDLVWGGASMVALATQGETEIKTIIHEFAHIAHHRVCEGNTDAQLEAEYNQAMELLSSNPAGGEFEQGVAAGFPSEYSRSMYTEWLTEVTEDLIAYGTLAKPGDPDSIWRIQEMVIERLQEAMPNTDVLAYLAYRATYPAFSPDLIDPTDISMKRISPFDGQYIESNQKGGTLKPAVELRSPDGSSTYLFGHFEEVDGKMTVSVSADLSSLPDAVRVETEDAMRRFVKENSAEGAAIGDSSATIGNKSYKGFATMPFDLEASGVVVDAG